MTTQTGCRKSSVCRRAMMLACLAVTGCTGDWANLTASLGGGVAGGRGSVGVLVINNTPYRAVFTVGTYDQTDPASVPDFSQFGHDEDGLVLDGNESSPIGTLDCARVFSVGGSRMLGLLEENGDPADLLAEAAIEGVEFFEVDPSDAEAAPVSRGRASPFEVLLGVDFPCDALLILRFEENDAGGDPFRVDFELIASESTR